MQSQGVKKTLAIQGRPVGTAELEQVRGFLAAHHDGSRYRLSRELCRVWNWRCLSGQIKDMAACSLLLKLLMIEGKCGVAIARALKTTAFTVQNTKRDLGNKILEFMGTDILVQI